MEINLELKNAAEFVQENNKLFLTLQTIMAQFISQMNQKKLQNEGNLVPKEHPKFQQVMELYNVLANNAKDLIEKLDNKKKIKQKIQIIEEPKQKTISFGKLRDFQYSFLSNDISKNLYDKCILCQQRNLYTLEPLLLIYTYQKDPAWIPMHEQCALWSNDLKFFSDNPQKTQSEHPNNISIVLREAQEKKCSICQLIGATLKCTDCSTRFHFPCFMLKENYGSFDKKKFQVQCEKHKKKINQNNENERQLGNDNQIQKKQKSSEYDQFFQTKINGTDNKGEKNSYQKNLHQSSIKKKKSLKIQDYFSKQLINFPKDQENEKDLLEQERLIEQLCKNFINAYSEKM